MLLADTSDTISLYVGPSPYSEEQEENEAFAPEACGVERWSVKTGTDADSGQVGRACIPTTVASITSIPRPGSFPANNRVAPGETTVWQINATLVQYKREDDQDYHLVLKDDQNRMMIAEIDDPGCIAAGGRFANFIACARVQFDATYAATTGWKAANVPVKIAGIGFFDFPHGQTGYAAASALGPIEPQAIEGLASMSDQGQARTNRDHTRSVRLRVRVQPIYGSADSLGRKRRADDRH